MMDNKFEIFVGNEVDEIIMEFPSRMEMKFYRREFRVSGLLYF